VTFCITLNLILLSEILLNVILLIVVAFVIKPFSSFQLIFCHSFLQFRNHFLADAKNLFWSYFFNLVCGVHRDKTRVQMPARMFPHLKLLYLLLMGPTLGFDAKQRNSFLIKFGVFFYNKCKIMTILFIVKYEKITLFDEFLVLLGTIISRFFACSKKVCLLWS